MAYKTLVSSGRARLLEKKGDSIEGFLVSAETGIGKFKSAIYTLRTKDGPVKLWGNTTIDGVLLDVRGKAVAKNILGCMVRITCTQVRTERKGKQTKVYRDLKVECDTERKFKENVPF